MPIGGIKPLKPGYGSAFSVNENPLREGGHWRQARTDGTNWHDMITVGGLAYGTQNGDPAESGHPDFEDSIAILTGTWGPNQRVEATVFMNPAAQDNTALNEVELWVHGHIEAGYCAGYECTWSCRTSGFYGGVARWNGSLNSFTSSTPTYTGGAISNGDHLAVEIINNVIIMYTNGVAVFVCDVTTDIPTGGGITLGTALQGNPGMGHWFNKNGTGTTMAASDWGWKNYSARNI